MEDWNYSDFIDDMIYGDESYSCWLSSYIEGLDLPTDTTKLVNTTESVDTERYTDDLPF